MTPPKEPKRGRPRDPATDIAILTATIEELASSGYENASIEAISRRSGTGKATIYRRYPNKAELVVAAVNAQFEQANPAVPNTGDAVADLTTLVYNTARMLTATPMGEVIRAIVPALPRDHLLASLIASFEKKRRQLMLDVLSAGVARGQFQVDDQQSTIDALLGAIYLRFLLLGKPVNRRYVHRVVNAVIVNG